jgi:hypothetical protein
VNRFKVKASSFTGAIRKVAKETGYSGRIRKDWDSGCQARYNVQGACICFFVNDYEPGYSDHYNNIKSLW